PDRRPAVSGHAEGAAASCRARQVRPAGHRSAAAFVRRVRCAGEKRDWHQHRPGEGGRAEIQLTAMHWRVLAPLLTAAALAMLAAAPATAQDYPVRPITLVVPFPPGGGNDALARAAAERMSKTLGQQVVVENRGGAGGTVATRAVAKAPPDGYTILLAYTGTLAINPTLYPNPG